MVFSDQTVVVLYFSLLLIRTTALYPVRSGTCMLRQEPLEGRTRRRHQRRLRAEHRERTPLWPADAPSALALAAARNQNAAQYIKLLTRNEEGASDKR